MNMPEHGNTDYLTTHFSTVRVCEEMFTPTLTRFLPLQFLCIDIGEVPIVLLVYRSSVELEDKFYFGSVRIQHEFREHK